MPAPRPLTVECPECGGEGRIYRSKYGGNDPDVWDAGPCEDCDGTGEQPIGCEGCWGRRHPLDATEVFNGLSYCADCAEIVRDEFAAEEVFIAADARHPPMLCLNERLDEYRRGQEGGGQ